MRIHHLTFLGLGPFRDQQVIDFRDLSASGLFLLEGPTGSGKSTVIDAIVFALYGQVAAGAADKGRLVSHYLDEGVQPSVEMVFETGSGIYRVRRTPEYQRPKKRGEGTTSEQATVNLVRLSSPDSPDGEVLSTRVGEADAEIARAIGLTRDQFIGTVVLPQGEFASFLRAKVEERAAILQRIFRTEMYERIQKVLDDRRKEAVRERSAADADVKVAVGELIGAAGLPGAVLPEWDGAPSSADELAEAVRLLEERLAAAADELDAERGSASKEESTARSRRDAVVRRVELRDRRREAESRRTSLDGQREQVTQDERRVDLAERAARVADQMLGERSAQARLDQARATLEERRAAAPQDCRDLGSADLEAARTEADTLAGHLADLVAVEAGLPGRRAAIDELEVSQRADRTALQTVDARIAQIPGEKGDLATQQAEARASAGRADQLRSVLEALAGRAAKARQLTAEQATASRKGDAVAAAAALAREASSTLSRLRSQYYDGIAAELAGTLVDAEPCPVCGSAEHPHPAAPDEGHVTAEQVAAAEEEHQRAADALVHAQSDFGDTQMTVAALDAVVQGATPEELDDAHAATAAHLAQAEEAQERVRLLEASSSELDAELDRQQEQRSTLTGRLAESAAQIRALGEALDIDTRRAEEAKGDQPSVAERVAVLKARSRTVGALLLAAGEERDSAAEHARQATALGTALGREGFADAAAAEAAALPAAEVDSLRRGVVDHKQQRAINDKELAAPELQGVDPDEEIDVAEVEDALADAVELHQVALGRHRVAADRVQAASAAAAGVADRAAARRALWEGTEALIGISRLANADTPNVIGLNLSTYVLQRRFESVVAAANEHLRHMSDGTLALVAHQEAEGRARRGGLGLRIMDLRTEKERPTGTLSGGETFFTALSLALGLAGVVTAEAGGVALDTLFVDEGFGTLDPETLDDVLSVLTSLRAGGRVVGIVSHVDELKARIPERIEVRRDQGGPSRITVVA